jgi:hypothetical protein
MTKEPIRDKPGFKKTYGLRLNQSLMKDLAHLAVDEEKWVNEMIEEAVRDLLKKYRDKRK